MVNWLCWICPALLGNFAGSSRVFFEIEGVVYPGCVCTGAAVYVITTNRLKEGSKRGIRSGKGTRSADAKGKERICVYFVAGDRVSGSRLRVGYWFFVSSVPSIVFPCLGVSWWSFQARVGDR